MESEDYPNINWWASKKYSAESSSLRAEVTDSSLQLKEWSALVDPLQGIVPGPQSGVVSDYLRMELNEIYKPDNANHQQVCQ
jgi:hypothetical protein